MFLWIEHINLRKSSQEEINIIIVEMVTQVHNTYNLRNRIVNNATKKASSNFIKDITHKLNDGKKKEDPVVVKVNDSKAKKW